MDRLGRSLEALVGALSKIEHANAVVESLVEGPQTLRKPGNILTTAVRMGMASEEKAGLLQKMGNGSRRRAAEDDAWLGGPSAPYGYKVEKKSKRSYLALGDPQDIKTIQCIFTMSADGKTSRQIAEHLNNCAIPTPGKAVKWRRFRVREILANPSYMGRREYGRRKVTVLSPSEGLHKLRCVLTPVKDRVVAQCPAIVDADLWARANATLKMNRLMRQDASTKKFDYLLSGRVRCGECGRAYIGHTVHRPSGKVEFYYRAHQREADETSEHKCPSVRGDDLERAVWGQIEVFLSKPGKLLDELRKNVDSDSGREQMQKDILQLENALADKLLQRERVNRRHYQGHLSDAEVDKFIGEIEESQKQTEQELNSLRQIVNNQNLTKQALNTAADFLRELRGKLRSGRLSFAERRQIALALVLGLTVHRQEAGRPPTVNVIYAFQSHLQRFLDWGSSRNTGLPSNATGSLARAAARKSSASVMHRTKPIIARAAKPAASFLPIAH